MPNFCRSCVPLMRGLVSQKDQEIAALTEELEMLKQRRTVEHYQKSWMELKDVKELLLKMETRMQREIIEFSGTRADVHRPAALRAVTDSPSRKKSKRAIMSPSHAESRMDSRMDSRLDSRDSRFASRSVPSSPMHSDFHADAHSSSALVLKDLTRTNTGELPNIREVAGWGHIGGAKIESRDVEVKYANGETIRLENCKTVGDVKIKIATRHERFAPEITLSNSSTRKPLVEDETPVPSSVMVAFQQITYTDELMKRTILAHARARDVRGTRMAMQRVDPDVLGSIGGFVLLKYLETSTEVRPEIIEVLIASKVDPNYDNGSNPSALALGATGGMLDMVQYMIDVHADVNRSDRYGQTALMHAAIKGHIDMVDLLIVSSADHSLSDRHGQTALFFAVARDKEKAVLALIRTKSDINSCNEHLRTPLMEAASYGHTSMIELLLHHCADVHHSDGSGHTVLSVASAKGFTDIIEQVVQASCDVNVVHVNGWTPLFEAAGCGAQKLVVVQQLIFHSADVNHRDPRLRTSLMRACHSKSYEMAQILLEARASVNEADTKGRTALYEASMAGDEMLVELLRSAGSLLPEELEEARGRQSDLSPPSGNRPSS